MIFLSPPWTEGIKRGIPIVLAYLPVGFAFGILAVKNGITPGLAVAMAFLMFSGSGQFIFASLWGGGAGILATSLAVSIVNLRYLLMSATEATWPGKGKRWLRFFMGIGITDETFVVHAASLQSGWRLNFSTIFVCNSFTHLAWISGCAIGAFCGTLVNDAKELGLDYAITAMFIALLIPQCSSRLHLFIAITAMSISIGLKYIGLGQWNIAIATIIAATVGLILSKRKNAIV